METSWRCGDLVVKPLDLSIEEVRWRGALFEAARERRLSRLAAARRSATAGVPGSTCAGEHRERAWSEIIAVGERFHAAIVGRRRGRRFWISAQTTGRSASASPGVSFRPRSSLTSSTCRDSQRRSGRSTRPRASSCTATSPATCSSRTTLPPAVIDFSPYWRPTGFASAVVVGDALLWEGADADLLKAVDHVDDFPQFLRAGADLPRRRRRALPCW